MRLRWWIIWGLVIWFIIAAPHAAAGVAHGIGTGSTSAARGISQFFADL